MGSKIQKSGIKVLGVFCHPDDECIFGWPIMQNPKIEKRLIILVSDRGNWRRWWNRNRTVPLAELCKKYRIQLECLGLNSEFYRTPARGSGLMLKELHAEIIAAVQRAIAQFTPDLVFTHNPHGEYGMGDHKMLFELLHNMPEVKDLVVTDIHEQTVAWPLPKQMPKAEWDRYYADRPSVACRPDPKFYKECKQTYEKHNAWTWKDEEPPHYPKPCKLYLIKGKSKSFKDLK